MGLIHPVTLDGDRITISQTYGADFAWKGYSEYYRQYYGLNGHNGIDYGGWGIDGAPVHAAAGGTVVFAGPGDRWDSTVGGGSFTVVIHHPKDRIWTAYLHLRNNSNTVTGGEQVKQGQMIARAGDTGIGTGAHLHFQVMPVAPLPLVYQPNWGCINPKPYMTTVAAQAGATITPVKDWFDMADKDDLKRALAEVLDARPIGFDHVVKGDNNDMAHYTRFPGQSILNTKMLGNDGKQYRVASFVRADNARILEALRNSRTIIAQNEALTAAVAALAGSKGIDVKPIIDAIDGAADRAVAKLDEAIDASMDDLEVTLTVKGDQ